MLFIVESIFIIIAKVGLSVKLKDVASSNLILHRLEIDWFSEAVSLNVVLLSLF